MSRPVGTFISLESPRMKSCCCCLKLKTGVVIISILWILYGIYQATANFLAFQNRNNNTDNFFSYVSTFAIIEGILSLFTVIGALYGLLVVSFANRIRLFQKYVIIAWIIALIQCSINIAEIIILVSRKNSYIQYCESINYTEDMCLSTYNILVPIEIAQDLFMIIISIYFATVVAAYRAHRHEKESSAGIL
ncbi:13946_t:CDS:2 [Ambispora leptoticha]|uniref:13946_t:CDS:1 n=1 Tax=Ambispora leptoticha TaxID=144679 RepID=A0A9N9GIT2_9GLOM|nr:13946_t:CDS:2 [Ambispora leptoticha]